MSKTGVNYPQSVHVAGVRFFGAFGGYPLIVAPSALRALKKSDSSRRMAAGKYFLRREGQKSTRKATSGQSALGAFGATIGGSRPR